MEKYSVLMSVYCKEDPEYLEVSVNSMLQQTVPPDEFVLVCDGGLTPGLDRVIASFCVQYPELFQLVRLKQNMGLGPALNAGLLHCRNELVARMDSDDIALPRRMELQLEEMGRKETVSVLGGQIAEFDRDPEQITGYRMVPTKEAALLAFLQRRSPMNHTTVLLRKSHVLAAGGYPALGGFEDYVLWASMVTAGYQLRNLDIVCCKVRADAAMYRRRGGIPYFQNAVKMERHLLTKGLISARVFRENLVIRFLGTMVLTPGLRRLVFLRFLRKQEEAGAEDRTPSCELPGQACLRP